MKKLKFAVFIILTLALTACGGGGDESGTPVNNSTLTPQPIDPEYTISPSRIAIPLSENRALINVRLVSVSSSELSSSRSALSFILYNFESSQVTTAFSLTLSDADLLADFGTIDATPVLFDLINTPDGGIAGQYTLFSNTTPQKTTLVIFKLNSDFSLAWSKKMASSDGYGRLQSVTDGYISTGSTITKLDLSGELVYSKSSLSTFSATTVAGDTLVGSLNHYMLLDAQGDIINKFISGTKSDVFYYGIQDSDNNMVMSGYTSLSGIGGRHLVLKTNEAGNPDYGIWLDLPAGASGFREIIEMQNSYYAAGVINEDISTSHGLICKFTKSLEIDICKSLQNVNTGSDIYIREDKTNNRLYVSNIDTGSYPYILDKNLSPVKPLNTTWTTIDPFSYEWTPDWDNSDTPILDISTTVNQANLAIIPTDTSVIDFSYFDTLFNN